MPAAKHERALEHAYGRLRSELSAQLTYHCAAHTIDDVVPAVRWLVPACAVAPAEARLIEVAAAFHDLGFVEVYDGHEDASIAALRAALPDLGYTPAEIDRLATLIEVTRMPQTPHDLGQQVLADADLDSLGREDFLQTSIALWRELRAQGRALGWPQWLEQQQRFLGQHRYFTAAARQRRDAGKQRNLQQLAWLRARADDPASAPD